VNGGPVVASERLTNAWRQRGWQDGDANRDPHPPADPEHARAYLAGYRNGVRRHREGPTSAKVAR
jgi:hypothetical protein